MSNAYLSHLNSTQLQCLNFQITSAWELVDGVSHWMIRVEKNGNVCLGIMSVLVDRTASLWSPPILSILNEASPAMLNKDIEVMLLNNYWRIAETQAKNSKCHLLQLLVDSDDELLPIYQITEIPFLTELSFYQLTIRENFDEARLSGEDVKSIYLQQLKDDDQELFEVGAQLIEESYIDSQDCPEVLRGKSGKVVIEGFRFNKDREGKSKSHIMLFAEEGKHLGIIIFKEHGTGITEQKRIWELAYIGLPAIHRGKGKGSKLLLLGLDYLQRNGAEEIVVAVDRRNYSAIKMYEKFGFKKFHEQELFVRLVEVY